MTQQRAEFYIGQIIRHTGSNRRGVIVDIDPVFSAPDEFYQAVLPANPPKDKPWYHVLVDDAETQVYVAEQYLCADESEEPISHPYVDMFFSGFDRDHYVSRRSIN
jgi:heat shock protein HspQ